MQSLNLLWFVITLATYIFGIFLLKISKNNILISPAVISIIFNVIILYYFNISYKEYMQGGCIISFFLSFATISLAVPMYKNRIILIKNISAISISVLFSAISTIFISYYLSKFIGADKQMQLSINWCNTFINSNVCF